MTLDDTDELWRTLGRADVMANYVDLADHSAGWTRERTAEFIAACVEAWKRDGVGRWALIHRITGELIGHCGLSIMDYLEGLQGTPELSFRIHPDYWGQGLTVEAAFRAIEHAFAATDTDSVLGCHVSTNHQSRRVMEKLGLTYERRVPYHSTMSGAAAIFEVHRITRLVWSERQT